MEWNIKSRGHKNILAKHKTTWQLTKETHLTPRGDCIIGVSADQAACDIPSDLKEWLQDDNWVKIRLQIGDTIIEGSGRGNSSLEFTDKIDMVFRRSDYTCPRTITTQTTFVAADIDRGLLPGMKQPETSISVRITPVRLNSAE